MKARFGIHNLLVEKITPLMETVCGRCSRCRCHTALRESWPRYRTRQRQQAPRLVVLSQEPAWPADIPYPDTVLPLHCCQLLCLLGQWCLPLWLRKRYPSWYTTLSQCRAVGWGEISETPRVHILNLITHEHTSGGGELGLHWFTLVSLRFESVVMQNCHRATLLKVKLTLVFNVSAWRRFYYANVS